ncbi:lytic transglycosylase domain-containing protein [Variovorax sp. J22P240]|uniref:lytic transglycosylase domain-containing protein n=1 Tax=Variovorax sp. J22P240 TaxID=3053514 RepID=UPI002574A05F|nr:lytic transglycosylase domain-containing protein [Variovorax sp. J22P240]MDL9998469.1 lytic transglycosylase domain-containing protein [Variovorax sp. J22P240]
MGCQDLAVPAAVMRHVVHVESGANPYAIGVVGGRLERQPKTLDEALATARMLEAKGYNFSLGMAQVNRANLGKYGLNTHEKAFDACSNLAAGARILADCYASAQGDWGKAFSCYYSGNFVTGFQHGYVQKVYDSISRGRAITGISAAPAAAAKPASGSTDRIAMRSVPVNAVPAIAPAGLVAEAPSGARPGVFVPQVRGPGDPPAPTSTTDQANLRKGTGDGAFVF